MCGLRGKESCWLELLCESLSCGIIKYFDVIFYICQCVNCMVMCTEDNAVCRGRGM
jgi:hypothetical protein